LFIVDNLYTVAVAIGDSRMECVRVKNYRDRIHRSEASLLIIVWSSSY